MRAVKGHAKAGTKPLLHPTEMAELVDRARSLRRRYGRARDGEWSAQLVALADDYGIHPRTVQRYLSYGTPRLIHIGPWQAWFATRRRGKRRDPAPPVQLTVWEKSTTDQT